MREWNLTYMVGCCQKYIVKFTGSRVKLKLKSCVCYPFLLQIRFHRHVVPVTSSHK